MMRFFVNKKEKDYFLLDQKILQHIKVARIQNKDFICVFSQEFYVCSLENNLAKIKYKLDSNHEFKNKIYLAAAIINIKRYEWLIQKATELGVTDFIPVISQYCELKNISKIENKLERWQTIALGAAEQSFRNKTMQIHHPTKFDDVINLNITNKFIAHEKISTNQQKIDYPTDSIFLVGPEGGFSDEEISKSEKKGFQVVSLGKRILRAETAAIYLLSKIFEKEE
ncbi:16S rRNA (uracil(1498)-N(3))-methyltransferase [Mycoplasma iguanae]|uniref:Ribosomal RNA small subunit methyltransferase E n=1 Tax=Mycoplasma iguanae TaxID=292461 RepID=A0ABY5R8F1_9MOLU|nr:16S rRNA (uracil(1498)-N(3))-methyltransferase [Mycoplasma iguanae]UVD81718.1 16S rRNA (uracil(1498)-N(3))-methyltransferase [Mycoplasma iguanae]